MPGHTERPAVVFTRLWTLKDCMLLQHATCGPVSSILEVSCSQLVKVACIDAPGRFYVGSLCA